MAATDEATYERVAMADASTCEVLEEKRAVDTLPDEVEGECQEAEGNEDAFGWMPHVDAESNTLCYVHSYTGEVQWPPVTAHSTSAQPFDSGTAVYQSGAPLNLYPPHLVMLPMGVTPTHPTSLHLDSWRGGYARYPMYQASQAILEDGNVPEDQVEDIMKLERRVLPSTWETSVHGPPFLAPFPVVILNPVWVPLPERLISSYATTPEVWWPTPAYCYSSMDAQPQYTPVAPLHISTSAPETLSDRQEYAPHVAEKVHNRRGYNLRQARKLMKQLGLHTNQSAKASQPQAPEASPRDQVSTQRRSPTLADDLHQLSMPPPAIRAN